MLSRISFNEVVTYMPDAPLLTILIPNYKTEAMTKLCLRLLRCHTDLSCVRVIVIDNQSEDGSVEYLRSVRWIDLLERRTDGENGPEMHARALDEALAQVTTPLVMVMHTDTLVIHDGWLDYLLQELGDDPKCAGVGSWKMEIVSPLKYVGKFIEEFFRRCIGRQQKAEVRYLRSHCALYRTGLLRQYTNGFFDGDTAGRSLFLALEQAGYHFKFLPTKELMRWLRHLNHATMILNPRPGDRKTARSSARRRVLRELECMDYRKILDDDTLDA